MHWTEPIVALTKVVCVLFPILVLTRTSFFLGIRPANSRVIEHPHQRHSEDYVVPNSLYI